jgi:hypothetical protein
MEAFGIIEHAYSLQDFPTTKHRPKDDFRKNKAKNIPYFQLSERKWTPFINISTLTLQPYQHINGY